MACPRGKAAPDENTKLRLFASSGTYCQNPACTRQLFIDTGSKRIHIAEIAHVFAATNNGPRANKALSLAERGAFDNLILLCSVCHTVIDKAEQDYPDSLIATWKRNHQARLANMFGVIRLKSRSEVFEAIHPLLHENRIIFEEYHPDLDYREDPESEMAAAWKQKMREKIIPNNHLVLAILEANREHMIEDETRVLELFRQHIHDLEVRHFTDIIIGSQRRFPEKMNHMMRSL